MGKADELLMQGWQCQQAGDSHQAEQYYREAVRVDGNHAEAWLMLGIQCLRLGKRAEAIEHLRQAILLQPNRTDAHINLGVALAGQGRRIEAIASFERALALNPASVDAQYNLGFALREEGRFEEALTYFRHIIASQPFHVPAQLSMGWILFNQKKISEAEPYFRQAVRLAPSDAEAHCSLGRLLIEQEKLAEAVFCFEQACWLRPDYAEAHANHAMALLKQSKSSQALASLSHAARLKPDSAEVHNIAGVAHAELGDYESAVGSFLEALRLSPNHLDALVNLGDAHRRCGRLDEAVTRLRQALSMNDNHADAHHNLALTLADQRKFLEAFQEYDASLRLQPENPLLRKNRALTLLRSGDWEKGWAEFEWFWKCKEFKPWAEFQKQTLAQPRWVGGSLTGKTILLYPEQGLGDALQFIRYAPLIRQRGATVLFACPAPLQKILSRCPGIDQLLGPGSGTPAFDVQATLMSLPGIFGTTIASVPAEVPYVFADPELVAFWQRELCQLQGFRIGISWQGNTKHRGDKLRSFPLSQLAPLAGMPGVRLVSLQKGPGQDQIAALSGEMTITDLGNRLDESSGAFMDTAAVMKNLDLVITCDTAIGHLAGALGVPVWLALSHASDWRWLLDRPDTPWYPTMRLFRQKELLQWDPVFAEMAHELRERLGTLPG